MRKFDVIWLNGSFDILHEGHLEMFKVARETGSNPYIIVGTDTDERIRKFKGNKRPINNLQHRMAMLNALKGVDTVVSFDSEQDLRDKIALYSVDYIVVGEEYRDKVVGGDLVNKEIIYVPKIDGKSTTNIIEKIKNL